LNWKVKVAAVGVAALVAIAISVVYLQPHSPSRVTYSLSSIPSRFAVDNYSVRLIANGTGYEQRQTSNVTGYEYWGFVTAFNVTSPQGETRTIPFFWNGVYPYPPTSGSNPLPSPSYYVVNGTSAPPIATAFGGAFTISWSKQNSTFYITFFAD